jgi:hypothetical protein
MLSLQHLTGHRLVKPTGIQPNTHPTWSHFPHNSSGFGLLRQAFSHDWQWGLEPMLECVVDDVFDRLCISTQQDVEGRAARRNYPGNLRLRPNSGFKFSEELELSQLAEGRSSQPQIRKSSAVHVPLGTGPRFDKVETGSSVDGGNQQRKLITEREELLMAAQTIRFGRTSAINKIDTFLEPRYQIVHGFAKWMEGLGHQTMTRPKVNTLA